MTFDVNLADSGGAWAREGGYRYWMRRVMDLMAAEFGQIDRSGPQNLDSGICFPESAAVKAEKALAV